MLLAHCRHGQALSRAAVGSDVWGRVTKHSSSCDWTKRTCRGRGGERTSRVAFALALALALALRESGGGLWILQSVCFRFARLRTLTLFVLLKSWNWSNEREKTELKRLARYVFLKTIAHFQKERKPEKTVGARSIRHSQKDGATRCILGRSTCRPKIYCVCMANNFLRNKFWAIYEQQS